MMLLSAVTGLLVMLSGFVPSLSYSALSMGRGLRYGPFKLFVISPQISAQTCTPHSTLAFVKTHKTGSTTMSTVINRFGFARNLSFLLYKNDTSHGHFRQDIPKNESQILPPVGVKMSDYANYRRFDVMTSHVRFLPNFDFLTRFMNNGSKFITVLREPTSQWESAFFFFNCPKFMGIHNRSDSKRIDEFFLDPQRYWQRTAANQCKYYTRNGMWYDLSANTMIHTDKNAVQQKLRILDHKLDLVLITEYLDESLLLLKNMMCWDYEDILYVTLNQRNTTSVLTEKQRIKIRKWNMADTTLYDHYNKTLWRKIKEYGPEFDGDLAHFRQMLKEYRDLCGIQNTGRRTKHRIGFVATNNDTLCQSMITESNGHIVHRQSVPK